MRKGKTKPVVNLTILAEFQGVTDATPSASHLTFLVTSFGKPFASTRFGNSFRDWIKARTTIAPEAVCSRLT